MSKINPPKQPFRPLPVEDCVLAGKLKIPVREMARRRDLEDAATALLSQKPAQNRGRRGQK